jgi:plasmid maintenance system antidote protein VapI
MLQKNLHNNIDTRTNVRYYKNIVAQHARKEVNKMVKTNILKAKISEKKTSYKECAKALNVSTRTFSKKMNGITNFTTYEAFLLSKFLKLTQEEKVDIFLS